MKPYILQETNWKKVKSEKYDLAILPWGATEPHNYHLPYGTDNFQVDKIAEISAEKAWVKKAKVMVLPTVPFGVQNPGQIELPFCLHITPTTQKIIFGDIVKALVSQGIKKIVILNGHGGNDFKPIIREVQAQYKDAFLGLIDWFKIAEKNDHIEEDGDHAGELETSLVQYLFPELVLPLEEAGDGQYKTFKLHGLKNGVAWTPRNWEKVSKDTGVGNPKKSTPEKGRKLFENVTGKIGDFLIELAESNLNDLYQ